MIPATPPPPVSAARLQGQFQLAGRVTVAFDVRGERRGERVLRTWTFTPMCPTGPCPAVTLVRSRARGTDTLLLHRTAPARYAGRGSFLAPLRCAGRTYPKGEKVPFTITVRITAAAVSNGIVVATRVRASYANHKRVNLTPCVAVLGHDGAQYHGHLIIGPPAGAGRSPRAGRSVRRRSRSQRSSRPRRDPQRPQHVVEREHLATALGPRTGDHHVQAERPARSGEEALHPHLSRAWMGEPAGGEARGVERQRNPT